MYPWLQLGSDYIDVKAAIDYVRSINTYMIRMHNLDFVMKTIQMESVLLSSLPYELGKVRTSAIAFSPIVFACF